MNSGGFTPWQALVDLALTEDIGPGDITSLSTVAPGATAEGVMIAKQAGVISGIDVAAYVFERVDPEVIFIPKVANATRVEAGQVIAALEGNARSVLAGERVALNLLQRLSGVATLTAAYVAAVAGTNASIVDTRKTTPGLRALEKAAVRDGGGRNHRLGLSDGVLIKDNHLAAIGGADRVTRAIGLAKARAPHTAKVEVEVTTLAEAEEAALAGADIIMLDNMSVAEMTEAVRIIAKRALVEASGGVRLDTVGAIAATGVDIISVGALTHSAPALDISLKFSIR
ncbi:MAG: carboxylating nicotinate-nucleotide diphosphorylase [Thermomicrobiales bacterium]